MPETMPSANRQSGRYSGAWQIFVYNWHFYAAALVLDFSVVFLLMRFAQPPGIRLALYLIATLSAFWALSSLLVSHYVYDRSPLLRWKWLQVLLGSGVGSWANIHAGLDQSSDAFRSLFPNEHTRILDIYSPSEMSEPSIQRARAHSRPRQPIEKALHSALPLQENECDTIFLIFAAHELRRRDARFQFFCEISRALKPSGRLVLVEHLFDWSNLLAYGPGALHFFSRRQWRAVCRDAGFVPIAEVGITPFVRSFVFAKHTALPGENQCG